MKRYIFKVKIFFSIVIFFLVLLIGGGSLLVRNNFYFSYRNFIRIISFYFDQAEFIAFKSPNLSAGEVTEPANHFSSAASIPVLLYHGINESHDRFTLPLADFKDQLFTLKKAGYQTISLTDFLQFINGQRRLPDKSIIISFDDARRDSFYPADSILKVLNYQAVMFMPTAIFDTKSSYYLDNDELSFMIKSGRWDVQSHAVQQTGGYVTIDNTGKQGNFLSNKAWLDQFNRLETDAEYQQRVNFELGQSKTIIEKQLEHQVIALAYPLSDYGHQSVNYPLAESIITTTVSNYYKMAFRQVWPADHEFSQNYPGDNLYLLKRIEPTADWTSQTLLNALAVSRVKDLPYIDDFSANQGWKKTWGDFIINQNQLQLKTAASTTGAFIFLDGSYAWQNYSLSVKLDWQKGDYFSLITNYVNEDSYFDCVFNNKYLRINQRVNGQNKVLVEKRIWLKPNQNNLTLSMNSGQNKISCLVNGKLMISSKVNDSIHNGGIALKIWDQKLNNGQVAIKKVEVKSLSQ
jgi:hypothetical protein